MEPVKSDKGEKPSTRDCGNSLHCLMLDREEAATSSDCQGSVCQIKVEDAEESSTNDKHSVDWVESGEGDGPPASDHHNSVVLVKIKEGEESSFVSRWVSKDWAKREKEEPSSKHSPGSITLVKIEVDDEPSSQVAQKFINHIKVEEMEETCSNDCPGSRSKESFEEQKISDHKRQILMKWVACEGDEEQFPKEGERMEGSATAQSRAARVDTAGDESQLHGDSGAEGESADENVVTPIVRRKRRRVAPLPPYEDDPNSLGDTGDSGPETVVHVDRQHQQQTQGRPRRYGLERSMSSSVHPETPTVFAGLEQDMLDVHRLQHKALRSINRQLCKLNNNQQSMGEGMQSLAAAIDKLCMTLERTETIRDRAAHRAHGRMHRYTKAIYRLCTVTCNFTRRSINMQREMSECTKIIAKGLDNVTSAVELLQTANSCACVLMASADSEDTSSRSSNNPSPTPQLTQRRSGIHAGSTPVMGSMESELRPAPSRQRKK